MRVAIASDHGGYELKEHIKVALFELGIQYEDFGTEGLESVDYPDYVALVTRKILDKEADYGILICGTGVGMSIAANKVNGIRAALVNDCYTAKVTRQHNDSNILCLGGRTIGLYLALEIVRIWLQSEFEGGRHEKRLAKISKLENGDK